MYIENAKRFLEKNKIPYEQVEYESHHEYWRNTSIFHKIGKTPPCPIIVLVIKSKNGNKDIGLVFEKRENEFVFEILAFGGFDFELCVYDSEAEEECLLEFILEIMANQIFIIQMYDLKKKCWMADACFEMSDEGDAFDCKKRIKSIESTKGFWKKVFHQEYLHELYDWKTYRRILK